jgi:hypothetical protein
VDVKAVGPVLEQAMDREIVPDRFRSVVRDYFSRKNGNGGVGK